MERIVYYRPLTLERAKAAKRVLDKMGAIALITTMALPEQFKEVYREECMRSGYRYGLVIGEHSEVCISTDAELDAVLKILEYLGLPEEEQE